MNVLTSEFKETLTRAYMHLFDALTEVYMANNLSQGQSLYFATGIMRIIISDLPRTPASEYLVALFNTHKAIVAKKSMLVPDAADKRDEVIVPLGKARKVDAAIGNLIYITENIDVTALALNFELPKLPPLSEIVIQNEIRKNKPVHKTQIKQMIYRPAAFIKNYNLQNARRRTK